MGIKDLNAFLKARAPNAIKQITLSDIKKIVNPNDLKKPLRVSIDTSIYFYKFLYKKGVIDRNLDLERFMKIKGSRSRSGVLSVTIFTSGELLGANSQKSSHNIIKTGGCPMDCHYCPFEKDENGIATQPRSYLSTEPGNMRATENKHHPVGQVYQRLFQLEKN